MSPVQVLLLAQVDAIRLCYMSLAQLWHSLCYWRVGGGGNIKREQENNIVIQEN